MVASLGGGCWVLGVGGGVGGLLGHRSCNCHVGLTSVRFCLSDLRPFLREQTRCFFDALREMKGIVLAAGSQGGGEDGKKYIYKLIPSLNECRIREKMVFIALY